MNWQQKNLQRADFLRKTIGEGGIGAELGVHQGGFTQCLLDVVNPHKLYLLDPWYLLGKEWKWGQGNRSTIDALKGILGKFSNELTEGKVILNIGFDLDLLPTFPDHYFDWVYVDTSHRYEHTWKELQLLKLKVKKDGIIAGDDWELNPEHKNYGVSQAVHEFILQEPYEIIYSSDLDKQWAIRCVD